MNERGFLQFSTVSRCPYIYAHSVCVSLLKHFEIRWTEDSKFPIGMTVLCLFRLARYANHGRKKNTVVYGGPRATVLCWSFKIRNTCITDYCGSLYLAHVKLNTFRKLCLLPVHLQVNLHSDVSEGETLVIFIFNLIFPGNLLCENV